MHHRPTALGRHDQGLDRGLPLLEILLGLGKLLYVFGGILERDELTTAGQGNGIVEGARPISRHDVARTGQRRRRDDRTLCRAFAVAAPQKSRCRVSPLTSTSAL